MSDKSQVIPLYQKVKNEAARKRLNIKAAFFWCSSKKESLALSRMALAMDEAGFDDEDFARPIRVNLPIVDDLPEEGVFDTAFCDRYQLGDDGMTFALIPGATPLDPHNQKKVLEGTDETIVDGVDTTTGEILEVHTDTNLAPPTPQLTAIPTMTLSHRALAYYLAGDDYIYHVDENQKKEIITLELDQDNSHAQNMLLALKSIEIFETAPEIDTFHAVKAIKRVFPVDGKNPELVTFIKFLTAWSQTEHIDRGILVKEWVAGNRISSVDNQQQETPQPERYTRAVPQSTAGLRNEVAIAQLYPDAEPGKISRGQLTGAKDLQERGESVFTTATKTLVGISDILEYDTQSVFGVTRAIKWNGENPVKELRQQARAWLAENGMYENGKKSNGYSEWKEDPHATRHSVAPSDEEVSKQLAAQRGEFVPGISDPDDPKWVKTETGKPEEKPELVKKVADGIFDVSALMQNSSTHGEKQEAETTRNVQVQETDGNEKQAGDALPPGENHLGNGETTVTVNTVDVNQNTDFVSQNSDSVNHIEPELPETVPEQQYSTPEKAPLEGEYIPSADGRFYFEPGRYENLPNDVYHSANGISSTQLKDARISLMFYNIRHVIKTIPREETKAFLFGGHSHAFILEPGKIDAEYAVPVAPPADIIRTTADMTAIIKEHNDSLPALMTPEEIKTWIEEHNATLPPPLSLSAGAEDTANLYMSLPEEFQRIPEGTKHTAAAQKACIKEYNASLQPMLKLSGTRDQLLDQISTVSPELAEAERAKPTPLNTSGSRAQLIEAVRQIRPDAMLADDFEAEQERIRAGRTYISLDMYQHVKAIEKAVFEHPSASRLLNHPNRQSEVSYFGFDEETGLEVRVRPDLEIQLSHARIGGDLKTIDLGNVKQERLRDRLHREIIERDYHLSAAMYCDVANLDQFFWIFVNKTPGYHWVAVVEASPDLLALGRLEYRRTLRMINEAMETNYWPSPIEDDYTDELNDFDLRRLETLGAE